MDSQFDALADAITQRVTENVTRNVTEAVTRNVTEAVTRNVTEVVSAAERRLAEQARLNVEAVRAEARLAAEGYGATVDAIQRELGEIKLILSTRFADYDSVLTDHGGRITALEHKNP